jgi:hypothetical protein
MTRYYDFWIADMHHYTVEVDGNDEPTALWFDDLDRPQPLSLAKPSHGTPRGGERRAPSIVCGLGEAAQ